MATIISQHPAAIDRASSALGEGRARLMAAKEHGDAGSFGAALEPYRGRLHVHAYRILRSFHDAEDVVQETFLRAWRARHSYQGRGDLGSWLYSIATNASRDALKRRRAPVPSPDGSPSTTDRQTVPAWDTRVPWIAPYPDGLPGPAEPGSEPDSEVVQRETIELFYLAARHHLPPRQLVALILRDVVGWSARETADVLEVSVAASNSLLQRARSTMRDRLPGSRLQWQTTDTSDDEHVAVRRFADALERGDADQLAAALRDDARKVMPSARRTYDGRDRSSPGRRAAA